ncbi:tigger transposable element-derived protein 4-like [Euwallacea similis]|uniref:tigger transposable element-derived protein 4-like n=2 Tax=Euwallacea similis TaxID=1736056 RepID=UPI00344DF443
MFAYNEPAYNELIYEVRTQVHLNKNFTVITNLTRDFTEIPKKKSKQFSGKVQNRLKQIADTNDTVVPRHAKRSEICSEMGLSKSTVATIWKNKETILKTFESGQHSNVKKIKKPNNYEVDQRLLKWFSQQKNNNAIVSGAILQSKAEDFASKVSGNQEPKFNRSWIERFKRRHNITSGRIAGESTSVDMNIVDDWLQNKWPIIRSNFKDEDIFNGDETGLFFKLTPDRTLKFKGQTCEGGKLSKERITIFVVANLTGSEKRKLLVIGKSKNPRCFKNIVQLPVTYKSNKRAWMNSEIFINALREWDEELRRKKRKIILLVDNCPAHPDVKNLMWITLVFMPPNTSSKLQPMDQGVIHSLKSHYRRLLLSEMISCMDSDDNAIIASVSSASDTYDDDEEDEDAAYENNEIISVPTTTEALRYVSSIRQFLQSRNTPQNVLDGIAHVESHINEIHFTTIKQTKISDFFLSNS